MKIAYDEILKSKIEIESYMSNPSTNKIIKWIHKLYWNLTSKHLVILLKNSKDKHNEITLNDFIMFAEFVLATNIQSNLVSVARHNSRYIIEFNNDKYTYTIDTYGTCPISFYIICRYFDAKIKKKYNIRDECTMISTDTMDGKRIYDIIINFIIEYLQFKENIYDN